MSLKGASASSDAEFFLAAARRHAFEGLQQLRQQRPRGRGAAGGGGGGAGSPDDGSDYVGGAVHRLHADILTESLRLAINTGQKVGFCVPSWDGICCLCCIRPAWF